MPGYEHAFFRSLDFLARNLDGIENRIAPSRAPRSQGRPVELASIPTTFLWWAHAGSRTYTASRMKRRWQRWLVWLLPFLVARALVPAGFMLSVVDGGLELTFCPSVEAPSPHMSMHHDASTHHAHGPDGTQPSDQQHHSDHYRAGDANVCPFGVAGSANAPIPAYAATVIVDSTPELVPSYTSPFDSYRPLRAERIRGPPVSSLT